MVPIHNGAQAQLCFVDPCSALFHDISVGSKTCLLQRSASPVHLRLASTRFTLQRPMMSASGSQNISPSVYNLSLEWAHVSGPATYLGQLLASGACLPALAGDVVSAVGTGSSSSVFCQWWAKHSAGVLVLVLCSCQCQHPFWCKAMCPVGKMFSVAKKAGPQLKWFVCSCWVAM